MSILPPVMPDEFVLGYWGRIHALNPHSSPDQTLKALVKHFALPSTSIQRVEAFALAAQTTIQPFVQKHTLIPVLAAITQHFEGAVHGNPSVPKTIKQSWRRLQKPGAYFCPECALAQKSQWGFSYWMRCHQLLGVDWCLSHGVRLVSCDDEGFTTGLPHKQVSNLLTVRIEKELSCGTLLKRYSQIMTAFLNTRRRVGVREALNALSPTAAAQNINTHENYGSQYLSDIAIEQLPRWWLEALFPSINLKQKNVPFPPLDNTVLTGFAMPHAYALAMALLFDESEKALAVMPH